ncbi:MAG: hypothetical protein RR889_04145, partial [Akkermansia sp.]
LILSPEYGFPEIIFNNKEHLIPLQQSIKMLIKEKSLPKYGGKKWLRGETDQRARLINGIWGKIFSLFKTH